MIFGGIDHIGQPLLTLVNRSEKHQVTMNQVQNNNINGG
jgi:hypothetical protein